jgi:uncharacterized protein HemY
MNINNKTPGRVISKSWNLPNFSVKVLTLTLAFIVGLLLGPIISDENVQASGSCDSTTCELDYSGVGGVFIQAGIVLAMIQHTHLAQIFFATNHNIIKRID